MKDQAQTLRRLAWLSKQQGFGRNQCPQEKTFLPRSNGARVISVTSGKGGVGKTHILVNLAYALQGLGKQAMILDADLGLANVNVLLGLTPLFNIQHFIEGEKTFKEVLIQGPTGILILPGYSGKFGSLNFDRCKHDSLIKEFKILKIDLIIIDIGSVISEIIINNNLFSHTVIVIITPEPNSFTNAYTFIKILYKSKGITDFKIIVNMASDAKEAYQVFEQINMVAKRFLHFSLGYLGFILRDNAFSRSVRQQQAILEYYPGSEAAGSFRNLGMNAQ